MIILSLLRLQSFPQTKFGIGYLISNQNAFISPIHFIIYTDNIYDILQTLNENNQENEKENIRCVEVLTNFQSYT